MTAIVIEWLAAAAEIETSSEDAVPEKVAEAGGGEISQECTAPVPSTDPGLWPYRDRTVGMLRRYLRLAIEVGRLPSLLGREFFRTRVTSYHTQTFEDSVILVHDIEVCLELLDAVDRTLIGMIVMQEHSQDETAVLLQCTRRTIVRRYGEALDHVSDIFLKRNILARLPVRNSIPEKACQEGENNEFPVSCSG
ncbi:MAG: hypothetical protein WB952_24755 [Terriglobales bacterium]